MGSLVTDIVMFTEGYYIEQAMISQSRALTAPKQCIAQQSLYAYSMKGDATRLCMVIHLRYTIPLSSKSNAFVLCNCERHSNPLSRASRLPTIRSCPYQRSLSLVFE